MTNVAIADGANAVLNEEGPLPQEGASSSYCSPPRPASEGQATSVHCDHTSSTGVTSGTSNASQQSTYLPGRAEPCADACPSFDTKSDACVPPINAKQSDQAADTTADGTSHDRPRKRKASTSPERDPPVSQARLPFHQQHGQRQLHAGPSEPTILMPAPQAPAEVSITRSYPSRKRPFNLFNALLTRNDILLAMVPHLPIATLLNLYAISRHFHFLLNSHYTTYILAAARVYAPLAKRIFPFKCYGNLCINDPARRTNVERRNEVRKVPSFRWLKMVAFPHQCIAEMLALLAIEGHRLPKASEEVLGKIWFTMDIPSNANRIGLLHNRKYWTDRDLFVATMFFIKLDMRFTDPVDGDGHGGPALRKLLLGQRSLSALWQALKRTGVRSRLDLLRMWIRYSYEPAERDRGLPIFGVPPDEIGKLQLEGWGKGKDKLLRIDELVMREGIRRRLNLQRQYMDMMIWGYIDQNTFEDIPTPVLRKVSESGEVAVADQSDKAKEKKAGANLNDPDSRVEDMMRRVS